MPRYIFLTLFVFAAIGLAQVTRIGGQRDEHGCFPSAGYSWCNAERRCARPWEERDGGPCDHELNDCPMALCGPRPGISTRECADGSAAGFTGRCLRFSEGCRWEIRDCPVNPCDGVRCAGPPFECGTDEQLVSFLPSNSCCPIYGCLPANSHTCPSELPTGDCQQEGFVCHYAPFCCCGTRTDCIYTEIVHCLNGNWSLIIADPAPCPPCSDPCLSITCNDTNHECDPLNATCIPINCNATDACSEDERCVPSDITCARAPCQQFYCEPRDKCTAVTCSKNYQCDSITGTCVPVNCHAPDACPTDQKCIPSKIECVRNPCPQYTCQESQKCCDPKLEPGQNGNPICFEGHQCCPVTGDWICSIGDGITFSPCPGHEQGPFGQACKTSQCQSPKEWNNCGSACPPTCRVPYPKTCTKECVKGCFCPHGLYLRNDSRCVTSDKCPGGCVKKNGACGLDRPCCDGICAIDRRGFFRCQNACPSELPTGNCQQEGLVCQYAPFCCCGTRTNCIYTEIVQCLNGNWSLSIADPAPCPPCSECSRENEKCDNNASCCDMNYRCIGGTDGMKRCKPIT